MDTDKTVVKWWREHGSLDEMLIHDPVLRKVYRKNRRIFYSDLLFKEEWAERGFSEFSEEVEEGLDFGRESVLRWIGDEEEEEEL